MSSKELLQRAIEISTRLETINAQRLTPSEESKAELIALRKDLEEALTKLAQAKAESMKALNESTASKAELIATEKQLTKAQTDLSSLESSFASLKDEALKERRRADKAERSAKFWGRVAFVATLLGLGSAIHDSLD